MKTWRTWTAKEIARLESLRLDGRTASQIAKDLGRTLASVKCRLHQEGIERVCGLAHWLPILMNAHTLKGAAQAAGMSVWAVKQAKRKLRRAGFDIPNAIRKT